MVPFSLGLRLQQTRLGKTMSALQGDAALRLTRRAADIPPLAAGGDGPLKHLRFCRVVNLPTNGVAHFFFESAISARIAAR